MKVVGLISGGKDSIFNLLQCAAAGHEIVALANVEPNKDEMDSYMYQSVGHEVVTLVAEALGLPLYRHTTKGKAICKNKIYVETLEDEVEDLGILLLRVKVEKHIEGVSVGAIASDYQRTRVENVCGRLNLKCFAYLWRRDQSELLQEMVDAELDAIIIKVASIGLIPDIHLGMHIENIKQHLIDLNTKFGVNICGEGGEYETLTLDCPLFNRMINITDSENVILSDDAFAAVGYLRVKNAMLKSKFWNTGNSVEASETKLSRIREVVKNPHDYVKDCLDENFPQKSKKYLCETLPFPFVGGKAKDAARVTQYWEKPSSTLQQPRSTLNDLSTTTLPNIDITNCSLNYSSGWCCLGNVSGETLQDALACVLQYFERIKWDVQDVVFVNLFVRTMSEFSHINNIYCKFMPEVLPPARVCVATSLPPKVGIRMTVVAHRLVSKSQKVLPPSTSNRDGMHVQSISHWAPASIGPYSQCIKVGGIYYISGQIPLVPGTMEILNKPVFHQCKLTLRHVLRIMKAMNDRLGFPNVLQAIGYVTSEEIARDIPALWSYITKNENSTVTAVVVKELPKNAQLEWEVLACSYDNPLVMEEIEVIEDCSLHLKRCVYVDPYASSLVCNVSYVSKIEKAKKTVKIITQNTISSILKHCLRFLRKDLKVCGSHLCMIKLFYKSSDSSIATFVEETIKSSLECKVVATRIPVLACQDSKVFMSITGVCH